jgi:hypothetical protein
LAGPLRLITVEESGLQHDRASVYTQNSDGSLQNLRQVMVDRIAQDRTGHGIIGAERCKALPCRQGYHGGADGLLKRQHDLMDVGMGMPPIDKAFAPVAEPQLTIGNGEALEIQGGSEAEPVRQSTAMGHDRWLEQADLSQGLTARDRVGPDIGRYRVRAQPDPGRGLRLTLRRKKDNHRQQPRDDQSDSATAPRPDVRLARRKSRFIRVMVSILMSFGQAS